MARDNLALNAVLIVGAIGGERGHRTIHLIKQGADLQCISDLAGCQHRRRDPTGFGVYGYVQLAPRSPCLRAMLLEQPFAGAAEFECESAPEWDPAPFYSKHLTYIDISHFRGVPIGADRGPHPERIYLNSIYCLLRFR